MTCPLPHHRVYQTMAVCTKQGQILKPRDTGRGVAQGDEVMHLENHVGGRPVEF